MKSWSTAVLLAAVSAWGLMNFFPFEFEPTPELVGIGLNSPRELQDRVAEEAPRLLRYNCILTITLASIGLCLVPGIVLALQNTSRRLLLIGIGVVGGLVMGYLTSILGISLREVLDGRKMVESLPDPMMRDSVFYLTISLMLGLPLSVMVAIVTEGPKTQKVVGVLLAFCLAGFLLPIATSFFPRMLTHLFPPQDAKLTGVWFGMIAAFAILIPTQLGKSRQPARSDEAQEQPQSEAEESGD